MNFQIESRYVFATLTFLFGIVAFNVNSSFTNPGTKNTDFQSENKQNIDSGYLLLTDLNSSMNKLSYLNLGSSYFHRIYAGNGVDHMNINLVNLSQTGLRIGDEIGVFDGIFCVGSAIIEQKHMNENRISIPSSANDTIPEKPNGFIEGHQIQLKAYRTGKIYLLYFQTVNNSHDIFEHRGSMFALINFSRSVRQSTNPDLE